MNSRWGHYLIVSFSGRTWDLSDQVKTTPVIKLCSGMHTGYAGAYEGFFFN